jgi:hypothetical protein
MTWRWVERDLAEGWTVHVKPHACRLRRDLPPFLRELEQAGIRAFPVAEAELGKLPLPPSGLISARQTETAYPGSIYVWPRQPTDEIAGFSPATGDALAEWLGDFLLARPREDVRSKLARSAAKTRHAFVVMSSLSGVPFAVTDLLIADDAPLPTVAPDLPEEVTDAWVASVWDTGVGFRWSSSAQRWQTFLKRPLLTDPPVADGGRSMGGSAGVPSRGPT